MGRVVFGKLQAVGIALEARRLQHGFDDLRRGAIEEHAIVPVQLKTLQRADQHELVFLLLRIAAHVHETGHMAMHINGLGVPAQHEPGAGADDRLG